MKKIDIIAFILVIIGGINWGAVGFADFNFVMWSFIGMKGLQHLIYMATGIAAIWLLIRKLFGRGV
jgi:uncharacterized membrane protein YuzA (DUF378 family)